MPKTPEPFTYNADGNLNSDGRWIYTWDGENRLIKMEAIATVPLAAKQKLEYAYDYMGRRIQKLVYSWDVPTSSSWVLPRESMSFCATGGILM